MTDTLKFGTFKAEIGQRLTAVSVTLYFNDETAADAYYDWLVFQVLDKGEAVVRFTANNVRQGAP